MVAESAQSWTAGETIAEKYVLLRPIAKGGMGSVWVAQNKLTERKVAIKFMLPELATSPDTIQRFFREAKASARIDHPSIVDVLDLGTLPDGAPFLVMEYLEGRSFEKIIDTAPLAPVQAAVIMLDVARALSSAHAAGIVHRDLKPANIFIAKKGDLIVPKILDFGISKITSSMGDIRMTRTGAVLGSPAYMSPEQARGRSDIDGRADIWAVGVILYEAISGKLPFIGENYNQVMMSITLDDPKPLKQVAPAVDDDFAAIVEACLQKERE
ncbi:MAG: serine/threonine-protein kinase, partial [Polyangiales bacterium]